MMHGRARLIGLDWGSSSLRAYLFGDNGAALAVKVQPWGVLSSAGGDFAAAYHAIVNDWRSGEPDLPAIAAGMIGSTEGWVRAPYCACPAGSHELAAALTKIATTSDGVVHVIPGIEARGAAPDVMRGEETQAVGALALRPEIGRSATLVLPGTHSKWVGVDAGRVVRFTTYMTGELYAVVSEHSILGRPARASRDAVLAAGSVAWDAFDRGVTVARENTGRGIAPLLFLTRSLVLQRALRAEDSLDFLSGLLIGDELRSALVDASPTIALVGDPGLCERYARAFAAFGIAADTIDGAAPAGLWHIAREANLVAPSLSRV